MVAASEAPPGPEKKSFNIPGTNINIFNTWAKFSVFKFRIGGT